MLKNILDLEGIQVLNKVEQQSIKGGAAYKLVCENGSSVNQNIADCHCSGLGDGIYLINFEGGGYTTYDVLGNQVDSGIQ